ncbi:GNAT family N-acetyltransferase [uncultured Cohaesibacter sp.]|uniref:GNAT family N-acetyltransferase n=1 Tax=uncultured Cohaesibacter sp. TaxID=1002546 RepID=UPI002AAB1993|nr:GNAT family N-acetyltransferase [uncultured Cohaesibacter sp.]
MTHCFDTVSLSECKSAIPLIAQWFCYQWPDWYGAEGSGNAIADLEEWANGDALPLARLALSASGEPLGIAALKNEGLGEEYGFGPFLSAFYVPSIHRRRGVGLALIRAIEAAAREHGLGVLYCTTDGARSLIEKAGWENTGLSSPSERGLLTIYRRALKSRNSMRLQLFEKGASNGSKTAL